jgi:hypothetical protein
MLSKSQYTRGLQCHKSLWLLKNNPNLRAKPGTSQTNMFETGNRVGYLACQLFPGGVEIEFEPSNFLSMAEKTEALLQSGQKVIYEATFNQQGVFAMVDILVKTPEGWSIYEVKSSTNLKPYHLDDISVQLYAISQILPITKAFIIHINADYVRGNESSPDVQKLFKIEEVTEKVKKSLPLVKERIDAMEDLIKGEEPMIEIGSHCSDPHDCDFREHCWKHIPGNSVFELYRLPLVKKIELYRSGIVAQSQLTDMSELTKTQTLQVESNLTGKVHFDLEVIQDFMSYIQYPIHFFDFETFQDAIPRFKGQRPYMQIPFQYSLHILQKDGTLVHKEFLGDEHSDPREALIQQMFLDIEPQGTILAFNEGFEKGRIKEMAITFPQYQEKLLLLLERFDDLIKPFRKLGYYHPEFNGSFSIKSILPAMFPNDDELDYKKLNIQHGAMAMDTFANLHQIEDPIQVKSIRKDLLAYCRLDTLAMVRIYEKLNKLMAVGRTKKN